MELDFRTISAYAGIVSALVVVSSNAIAYWYKGRQERRRTLNEAVFNLLEIWKIASVLDAKAMNLILAAIQQNTPGQRALSSAEYTMMRKLAEEMWRPLIMLKHDDLQDRFAKTVEKLSCEQPVLAYSINGNKILPLMVDAFAQHVVRVLDAMEQAGEKPDVKEDVRKMLEISNDFVYQKFMESLKSDILELAEIYSPETYEDCERIFTRRQAENLQPELTKQMGELFSQLRTKPN